jgi:hypothetical protein
VRKLILLALLMGSILLSPRQRSSGAGQENTATAAATVSEQAVTVKITTGGGLYGPVKSQFKVGEEIPVTISMSNSGSEPVKYCRSSAVFQNRPQLKREGQVVAYLTRMLEMAGREEIIERCEQSAARQFYELQPKETRVVDWLVLNTGAVNWYGTLAAGHYEIRLQRRIECCQGAYVESEKIGFEVVP